MTTPPRYCWYGDDFTGATDTLAVLAQAGLRAMLFLTIPSRTQLEAAERALGGPLDAIGIAGATRAMPPDEMAAELSAAGAFFRSLACPVVHYKVCSTFDSAPEVGNIATAVGVLRGFVDNAFVPIVGGQPNLGRYCLFSNLFAAAGRGGEVERIDRHPTMRAHPVTPMAEADLRLHLAAQGLDTVAGFHFPWLEKPAPAQEEALAGLLRGATAPVLFDVASAGQLGAIGRLLWRQAVGDSLLAVGPSSVAQALVAHWRATGGIAPRSLPDLTIETAGTGETVVTDPSFVFVGSLSPVTARQVGATSRFEQFVISAQHLAGPEADRLVARMDQFMQRGGSVMARLAAAPADARTTPGETALASARFVAALVEARIAAGRPLRRIGIAGGDTSSRAVQALGVWGLSCQGTLGDGVTLSRTHSTDPARDALTLMLKGGQMGSDTVFDEFAAASQP